MPRKALPTINSQFSNYKLHIRRSSIHHLGVFAGQTIPRARKVIEYTGQRISGQALLKRAREMSDAACRKLIYLARANRYWVVDGGVGGSGAEIMNHSCEPNSYSRRLNGHILLFSRRTIRKGEELTWDYRYSRKVEHIPCRCGSQKCRGTINVR